ncbi:MAG: hypothetical protein Q9222_002811 [Ikaeria aurantiellina]
MAAPSPAEIQYQSQHITDDTSHRIISAFGVCLGFAIISVLLRFVARHITRAPLGGDDWTIVVGLILAIGYIIGQAVCISYGLGKHSILVTDPVSLTKAVNASVILYITSLAATKISILLLYRRIFPNRGFHFVLWGVGIFVSAFTVANVLFVSFACRPVSGGWNPLIKAKCIDSNAAILAVAILTTLTDFVILGLPLPLVWRLQLPTIRKYQLTVVFLLGTFASAVSIYRSTVISDVSKNDLSYDSTARSIWSGVEICMAIICANLATLRPILKYLFAGKALSTARSGGSKGTTSGSGKSYRQRWTWRNVAPPSDDSHSEGGFRRLEQHPGAQSTDDVERQKFEGYLMSPVGSPRMPDRSHFEGSQWRM